MEDIFELLLYIVIAVISIAGGLYKNYAKKKAEGQRQQGWPQTNSSPSSFPEPFQENTPQYSNPFEEFIQEQLEGDVPESIEYYDETETTEPNDNGTYENEGTAVFENTERTILSDDFRNENFSISEELQKQEEEAFYNISEDEIADAPLDLSNKSELRKAIIYSEILKRPEF